MKPLTGNRLRTVFDLGKRCKRVNFLAFDVRVDFMINRKFTLMPGFDQGNRSEILK